MPRVENWKTVLFLSIIIPASLFVSLRVTGTLRGSMSISNIANVEKISWITDRPTTQRYVRFDSWVKNYYSSGIFSVNFSIQISDYTEDALGPYSFVGDDILLLSMHSTVEIAKGFVHSMILRIPQTDRYSSFDLISDEDAMKLNNLAMVKIVDSSSLHEGVFETTAINQSTHYSFWKVSEWVFHDTNNLSHQITITLETVYFNGTTYCQTNIPIKLEVTVP